MCCCRVVALCCGLMCSSMVRRMLLCVRMCCCYLSYGGVCYCYELRCDYLLFALLYVLLRFVLALLCRVVVCFVLLSLSIVLHRCVSCFSVLCCCGLRCLVLLYTHRVVHTPHAYINCISICTCACYHVISCVTNPPHHSLPYVCTSQTHILYHIHNKKKTHTHTYTHTQKQKHTRSHNAHTSHYGIT